MEGFITLSRKLLEWEWVDDSGMMNLWVQLLLRANHEDTRWHGIEVKRGQLVTSVISLSKATGLTSKQVRLRLDRLEEGKQIIVQTTNKYTLVSICKYDDYQSESSNDVNQKANKGQTKGKQRATNNNENNKYNLLNSASACEGAAMPQPQEGLVTEDNIPELTDGWIERLRMMVWRDTHKTMDWGDVSDYYETFKSREVDPLLMTSERDWWQHFKNYLLKRVNNGNTGDRNISKDEQRRNEKEERLKRAAAAAYGMYSTQADVSDTGDVI